MKVSLHRIPMANPGDVSGLRRLIESGEVDPRRIVAMIGKTEGNGGANDFTRALATLSMSRLIGDVTGMAAESVPERVAMVWSGGCEGVISPHVTVISRDDSAPPGSGGGLAVAVERTRAFAPEEIGTLVQVDEVAAATRRALEGLAISDVGEVHYVQVKGPLLTPASLKDAARRGAPVVTMDPNASKAYARGAPALGVAVALGEVDRAGVSDEAIARDLGLYSRVASTSAGGELVACEVIAFANSPTAAPGLRIGHAVLRDVVDADGVVAALRSAGLDVDGRPDPARQARIAAVFAKAEASPTGEVRGWRTTMLSDADINYERHARASLGAVIASVTGDPGVFVSGGTEHQCAPGEAPIAAIVRSQ